MQMYAIGVSSKIATDRVSTFKSIALGADLVGQAGAVLQAATQSTAAVIEHFELMADGLRLARFCGDGLVQHRQQH